MKTEFRQKILWTLALLFCWTAGLEAQETPSALELLKREEAEQVALLERLAPSITSIYPPAGGSCGSGVLISEDGFALTNFHVVQPCGIWMKCGLSDGRVYHAVLVGIDPVGDLALIKLLPEVQAGKPLNEPKKFTPVPFGDSDSVRQGDRVWVLGNPFGFAEDFTPTASQGIVSGVHRYQFPAGTFLEYADCIQVDAAINPGNSGGPLFNAAGELIGINGRCSFEKRGRVNVGVGYAISVNQVKFFLSHLKAGRVLDHATLGASAASDALGRPVIDEILEDSEAALRGLEYGDRLVSFGGRPVRTVNDFKNVLGIYPKGWVVPVEFARTEGGKTRTRKILVRLDGVHTNAEMRKFLEQSFESELADPQKKPGKPGEVPEMLPVPAPAPAQPGPEIQPVPEMPQRPGMPGTPEEMLKMRELFEFLKEIPPEVQAVYEKRDGFANFFFNRQETQRVWQEFTLGEKVQIPEILTGTNQAKQKFELKFSAEKLLLKQESSDILWENQGDFARLPLPEESQYLLPGLALWRELCVKGPEALELTYFGESPLPFTEKELETPELFDVLEGNVGGVTARFFFRKKQGDSPAELRQMELELLDARLPWEFYFEDWHKTEKGLTPGSVRIFADSAIFEHLRIREEVQK